MDISYTHKKTNEETIDIIISVLQKKMKNDKNLSNVNADKDWRNDKVIVICNLGTIEGLYRKTINKE